MRIELTHASLKALEPLSVGKRLEIRDTLERGVV